MTPVVGLILVACVANPAAGLRRKSHSAPKNAPSALAEQGLATSWDAETGSVRKSTIRNDLERVNGGLDATTRKQKYDKMGVTAFTFYRGTAHLYYRDLDAQDLINASAFSSSTDYTWIQGDMHVENFGAFDDDTGTIVFDLNDFDESWPTHYQYDVWRTAISLVLVARENGGFSNADVDSIVDSFSEFYLDTLEKYRGNDGEKDAKVTEPVAYGRLDNFLRDVQEKKSRTKMLDKWTNDDGSGRKLGRPGKIGAADSALSGQITSAINEYKDKLSSGLAGDSQYFVVKDVAERLDAGTGSLGTPRYYVLIEGASPSQDDDRILDVKLQSTPSMYPFLTSSEQGRLSHLFQANEMGCRVAYAQKALLTDADDHLGCATIDGESYSVRERSPFKDTLDYTKLHSVKRLTNMAEQYGAILASAHARADSDFDASVVPHSLEGAMDDLVDTKHAEFREEVRRIAEEYADQVAVDYDFFQKLRAEGSID